eukprot:scaffold40766_cov56-Phaeocystis_antarctica.AAC.1
MGSDGGSCGGVGGEGGDGGDGGGEGGEGGGDGDREVKHTLKPPLHVWVPSDDQLSAEASTPSGPSMPHLSSPDSVSKKWTCSSTRCANVTWHDSRLPYWPSVVLVAAHAPAAAKLEEHTQLLVRSNTHGPVAVASRGGCNGGEGGGGGDEGGASGGGEGDRKVKQTLKPRPTEASSDDQLSAEASTPSGPSVPE